MMQLDPEAGYLSESATVREIGYGQGDHRQNVNAFRRMRSRNADAVFEGHKVFPGAMIGPFRVYSREQRGRLVRWLNWRVEHERTGASSWKARRRAEQGG